MTFLPILTAGLAFLVFQPAPLTDGDQGQNADPAIDKLPEPFPHVTLDFGQIENLFQVTEVRLFAPGEFRVGQPGRVVAEETIVWTLEAKVRLTGAQIYRLFHNPQPRVSFFKSVDDRQVSADARPDGYRLVCDLRWFRLKPAGEDLGEGEIMNVWVHLGRGGSRGLLRNGATLVTLEMD